MQKQNKMNGLFQKLTIYGNEWYMGRDYFFFERKCGLKYILCCFSNECLPLLKNGWSFFVSSKEEEEEEEERIKK